MLGLRLDEPLPLAGARAGARSGAGSRGSSGSGSPSAAADALALTARGRFLGDGVTAGCSPERLGAIRTAATMACKWQLTRAAHRAAAARSCARVVEEYVATGQPVGSKTLVERAGARRLAVDRARRARRARAARAAHASAHLGRARADRGRLPPLRRRAARAAGAAAGASSRSSSHAARTEVEEALQATTEMLSQVTRLLALVSAPPLEAATVRHVEVLLLQPERRDGRRDHLDRRRHEAALHVRRAGRPGPRRTGPAST